VADRPRRIRAAIGASRGDVVIRAVTIVYPVAILEIIDVSALAPAEEY
jgi:hypothetical protein